MTAKYLGTIFSEVGFAHFRKEMHSLNHELSVCVVRNRK
jgi:hypothetical protein